MTKHRKTDSTAFGAGELHGSAPAKKSEVKITPAKGRPMLTWVGKRPLSHVTAFPAQHVETFESPQSAIANPTSDIWRDWPAVYPKGGLLFHGDNKEVLAHLLANGFRGKVNLIYIDPPFDSGADYVRKVSLRGVKGTAKLDGESYTLGEQIQYTDIWANDNYLQFMYERLLLLKELLSEVGSIYVHCDPRRSAHLRCLSDEVFGADHFRNEIVWKRADAHSSADRYGPIHDVLLYYAAGDRSTWNVIRTGVSQETADTWYTNEERIDKLITNRLGQDLPAGTVRRFNKADISAPGSRVGTRVHYGWKGHHPPPGRHWSVPIEDMEKLDSEGRLVYSSSGKVYEKRYLDEAEGAPLQSIWTDIQQLRGMQLTSRTGVYPTEKPEDLLERILLASSNPGDLILDCFSGSGTAAAVAQKLGRRWIGCDINKGAIQTTAKRLNIIIREQIEEAEKAKAKNAQGKLIDPEEGDNNKTAEPAQLAFAVFRVNDYDLAIQHNEAVNLACEHIGVQRTRTDPYFDGTLGKSLVKIIPFGHPLTPLDLEELKRELEARPEEDRPITVVCLGMELAAKTWIEDWNRLRKRKKDEYLHKPEVNRIDVIELRTDPKYGKFVRHEPATAKVKVTRRGDRIVVEIEDFISPTIIERLDQQAGMLKPKIDDWRAMVDCVMIDPTYDGQVFNVTLADVPEKKTDLVAGKYELPAPSGETTVAVKIIDMLGEEVLVTHTLFGASRRDYPPSQDMVIETFLKCLNDQRGTSYVITERPDESERRETEIDYVATDSHSGTQIAVEVSSVWRCSAAGKEDADWGWFTQRVEELSRGRVPGKFRVYTPLRIPPGLDAQTFSDELVESIIREDANLTRISQEGRLLTLRLSSMEVFVANSGVKGNHVSFGRRADDSIECDFPDFVKTILSKKSPKLKRHKERGRETWLVVYNTIWPLMSPFDVKQIITGQLSPEHDHIDHIGVIAGNPPEDAWLTEVR